MGYQTLSFAYKGRYDVCRLCDGFNGGNLFPYGNATDALPLLLGHASVHILFHYFYSCHPEPRIIRAHAASFLPELF
jgi:hypothetical protein